METLSKSVWSTEEHETLARQLNSVINRFCAYLTELNKELEIVPSIPREIVELILVKKFIKIPNLFNARTAAIKNLEGLSDQEFIDTYRVFVLHILRDLNRDLRKAQEEASANLLNVTKANLKARYGKRESKLANSIIVGEIERSNAKKATLELLSKPKLDLTSKKVKDAIAKIKGKKLEGVVLGLKATEMAPHTNYEKLSPANNRTVKQTIKDLFTEYESIEELVDRIDYKFMVMNKDEILNYAFRKLNRLDYSKFCDLVQDKCSLETISIH